MKKRQKKVLLFGTFDGIHKGHLNLLRQAKRHGKYLIVVVARDKTVKKVKKRLPSRDEKERLKELRECRLINEARLGYKDSPYRIIKEIKPDIICLGYNQKAFTKNLKKKLTKMGLKTKIYRMKAYQPRRYHSSIIKGKLC